MNAKAILERIDNTFYLLFILLFTHISTLLELTLLFSSIGKIVPASFEHKSN